MDILEVVPALWQFNWNLSILRPLFGVGCAPNPAPKIACISHSVGFRLATIPLKCFNFTGSFNWGPWVVPGAVTCKQSKYVMAWIHLTFWMGQTFCDNSIEIMFWVPGLFRIFACYSISKKWHSWIRLTFKSQTWCKKRTNWPWLPRKQMNIIMVTATIFFCAFFQTYFINGRRHQK